MKTVTRIRAARWLVAATMVMLLPAICNAGRNDWSNTHANDFAWSGRIASGKTIEIKGINGGIVAEGTSGREVEVVADKRWKRSDPDDVKIEVIEHEDGITICALYPTPSGERPNECAPGDQGKMNTRNNDVSIQYRVKVPAGVRFIGRTVNGEIEARGLSADAEAYTVNGDVSVSTRGTAMANTVNGSIDVEMGRALDDAAEFSTVNGNITLQMPRGLDAELRATTTNGSIESDYELTTVRRLVGTHSRRRRMSGTIGSGGPALSVTTLNGNIRLRSGS